MYNLYEESAPKTTAGDLLEELDALAAQADEDMLPSLQHLYEQVTEAAVNVAGMNVLLDDEALAQIEIPLEIASGIYGALATFDLPMAA
jgi:hypothetical protein